MAGKKTIKVLPVEAFCPATGVLRGQFVSLQDASQQTGAFPQAIHRALKAPGKWTAAGYYWRRWSGPPAPETKVCNRCKVELPIAKNFRKHGRHIRHICILCEVADRREHRWEFDRREAAAAKECWSLFIGCIQLAATGAKKVAKTH